MAVLFHELAADESVRAVRRAVGRLPMFPHDARPGGECSRFFHDALQVREGGKNEIKNQEGPVFYASPAEGPEKEQGKEGIEDGRSFKEKFIVHDARAEKETAGNMKQDHGFFRHFGKRSAPGSRIPRARARRKLAYLAEPGWSRSRCCP